MKCEYCTRCRKWHRSGERKLAWRNVREFCECREPALATFDDFLSDYAISGLLAKRASPGEVEAPVPDFLGQGCMMDDR